MFRSFKAIANRNVFANCKNRVVIRKAKTTEHATLHAPRAHSYQLCASLRGLLRTSARINAYRQHELADRLVHAIARFVDVGHAAVLRTAQLTCGRRSGVTEKCTTGQNKARQLDEARTVKPWQVANVRCFPFGPDRNRHACA